MKNENISENSIKSCDNFISCNFMTFLIIIVIVCFVGFLIIVICSFCRKIMKDVSKNVVFHPNKQVF